ncbi:DUF559 domain-containing protein [Streptomyces alboflavus]|uniref:DUF559 domain-containing protein n=1 Tax=Streptomyces alboflavus TaxID=67267 RepID=UPI0037A3BD57
MRAAWRRRRPDYTPPTCKTCSGEITSRSRHRAIYCSKKCKFADPEFLAKIRTPRRQVTKVCPECGKEYSVPVGTAHRYIRCSRACSNARGITATCKRCGAAFRHSQTDKRSHCSETCRRPPVIISCGHCGTNFRIVPSGAARKRYCSVRCYRASDAETSIERRVRETLEHLGRSHRSQVQIGPWVVDFLVGDSLVVEADGDYWHSLRPGVDRRKTADIADRGYTVWRLSETEINGADFPVEFKRRLIDYEVAHGEIPRVPPGEATAVPDEDRVVPRQAKRSAVSEHHPGQLLLDL